MSACSTQPQDNAAVASIQELDLNDLVFTRIEKKNITKVIECTGRIDVPPNQRAAIYAPIGGNIRNIRVLPGDKIVKGQVLFSLAHQDIIKIQQDYLIAKNELVLSDADYNRKKKLFEANSTSEKELLLAQRNYEVANANLQSLEAQIRFIGISLDKLNKGGIMDAIVITAPIGGYIAKLEAVAGAYVNPNNLILTIVNPTHKHVELDVYADKVNALSVGQQVGFHTAGSDEEFEAEIYLIGKEVDEETRTVSIHAHLLDEEANNLIVGSYLYAGVKVTADEVYSLPNEAIVKVEGENYILLKDDNQLVSFKVEVGDVFKGYTQILNYQELVKAEILAKDAFYYYN